MRNQRGERRQFDLITGLVNKKASVTGLEFAFEMPDGRQLRPQRQLHLWPTATMKTGKVLRGNVKNTLNLGGFFENDQSSRRA